MNRITKKIYAVEKIVQPLREIILSADYEVVNGFVEILIKRKNKFYLLTDKGDFIKFSTKSEKELEEFLNLLHQYDELFYKSLFKGEVFKVWLRKTTQIKVQRCKVISIHQNKKAA